MMESFPTKLAITREVSASIARCELTHLAREPIDFGLAREQHRRYEACLLDLGCEVVRLPAEPDLPDSVFVEDTAVVLDEIAVITRPGAESRRAETESVAAALEPYRSLVRIEAPALLDGGDVLRIGKTLYVGLSSRTEALGIGELRHLLGPFGYEVRRVSVTGCLHLKSAVTQVGANAVLINSDWVAAEVFDGLELIEIDPSEPLAANALLVDDAIAYPSNYPRTRRRLEKRGLRVLEVDVSELAKAEGGVTCCSLILEVGRRATLGP